MPLRSADERSPAPSRAQPRVELILAAELMVADLSPSDVPSKGLLCLPLMGNQERGFFSFVLCFEARARSSLGPLCAPMPWRARDAIFVPFRFVTQEQRVFVCVKTRAGFRMHPLPAEQGRPVLVLQHFENMPFAKLVEEFAKMAPPF